MLIKRLSVEFLEWRRDPRGRLLRQQWQGRRPMVLAERRTIQVIHTRKLSGGRVNNITDTDVPYVCIKFCIKLLILEHNFFFYF